MSIQLNVTSAIKNNKNDQEVKSFKKITFEVNQGTVVQADPEAHYELTDLVTGYAPEEIVVSRKGNDLNIEIGESDNQVDLTILNYYSSENYCSEQIVYGLNSEDGQYYPYVPQDAAEDQDIFQLSDNDFGDVQVLGNAYCGIVPVFPWWGIAMGALALLGIGIAVANNDDDDDNHNDSDQTSAEVLAVTTSDVEEGNPVIFTVDVSESEEDTQVNLNLGGNTDTRDIDVVSYSVDGGNTWVTVTPDSNGDFSVTVPAGSTDGILVNVTGIDDNEVDGDDTLTLTASAQGQDGSVSATADILDNDTLPEAEVLSVTTSNVEEGETIQFEVKLDDVETDTTVDLNLGGNTDSRDLGDVSYSLDGGSTWTSVTLDSDGNFTVTVPTGSSDGILVQVTTTDDTELDGSDSLTLTASGEDQSGSFSDTATIYDNDVSVTVSDTALSEADLTSGTVSASGTIDVTAADASLLSAATIALTVPTEIVYSDGKEISWSVSSDGLTLTGSADGSDVITITLDSSDISSGEVGYTVDLMQNIDHSASGADVLSILGGLQIIDSAGEVLTTLSDVALTEITDDIPTDTSTTYNINIPLDTVTISEMEMGFINTVVRPGILNLPLEEVQDDTDPLVDGLEWGGLTPPAAYFSDENSAFLDAGTTLDDSIVESGTFILGSFTHDNYPARTLSADLLRTTTLTINFTVDINGVSETISVNFDMIHVETPNVGVSGYAVTSDDFVVIKDSTQTIMINGESYTLNIENFVSISTDQTVSDNLNSSEENVTLLTEILNTSTADYSYISTTDLEAQDVLVINTMENSSNPFNIVASLTLDESMPAVDDLTTVNNVLLPGSDGFVADDGTWTSTDSSETVAAIDGGVSFTSDYGVFYAYTDGSYEFDPSEDLRDSLGDGDHEELSYVFTYTDNDGDQATNTVNFNLDAYLQDDAGITLTGTSGNDVLIGGEGDDAISGEDGNDVIFGGQGADTLSGGAGSDVLYFNEGAASIDGGAGDDVLMLDEADLTLDFSTVLANVSNIENVAVSFDDDSTDTVSVGDLSGLLTDTSDFSNTVYLLSDNGDTLDLSGSGVDNLVQETSDLDNYTMYSGDVGGQAVTLYVDQDLSVTL